MKAERRHQLKTNTLAEAMVHLPDRGKRLITVTLTIAIGGVLIFSLIRYRIVNAQNRAAKAGENLAVARMEIDELKNPNVIFGDPTQADERFKDSSARLDAALADAGDSNPKLAAEILIARGDLYWNMASVASSTTQPSLSEQTIPDLLKSAQAAYQQVIANYPQEHLSVTTARFGLAAVAENLHDWDEARKQYQAILDDSQTGQIMQTLARAMKSGVDQLEQPLVIGATTQPQVQTVTSQPAQ